MLYSYGRNLQGTKVTFECQGLAGYGAADGETSFHQRWRHSLPSLTAEQYRMGKACVEQEIVVAVKAGNDRNSTDTTSVI